MKINLRKANVIQNAIQDAIRDLAFEAGVEVNEFQDAESQIQEANQAWYESFVRRSNLLDALYDIRANVGNANVQSGINDVLAQVARLEKDIAFLSKQVTEPVRVNPDVLAGKLDKIRNRSEDNSMYSMRDRNVSTSFFSEGDLREFRTMLAKNKKSKQALQDRLLELNVETQISLNDATVETLSQEDLI